MVTPREQTRLTTRFPSMEEREIGGGDRVGCGDGVQDRGVGHQGEVGQGGVDGGMDRGRRVHPRGRVDFGEVYGVRGDVGERVQGGVH